MADRAQEAIDTLVAQGLPSTQAQALIRDAKTAAQTLKGAERIEICREASARWRVKDDAGTVAVADSVEGALKFAAEWLIGGVSVTSVQVTKK